jgi:hypothetical protein
MIRFSGEEGGKLENICNINLRTDVSKKFQFEWMQYIAEREPLFCLSKSRIEVKGIIVCLNEPLKINNLKPTVIDCCNVA